MEAKLHNWVRCLGCGDWVKKSALRVACSEEVTQCCHAGYETPQEVAAKGELPMTGADKVEFKADIQSNNETKEDAIEVDER